MLHPCSSQVTDPHTNEYLDRLKDEPGFLALAHKVAEYLQRTGDTARLPRIALRQIEHFYYKSSPVYDAMRKMTMAAQV
jgi:translation initiation factor 3 subunit C